MTNFKLYDYVKLERTLVAGIDFYSHSKQDYKKIVKE